MSVFGGDSSWRKDTPGAYMLEVVRAAGSFGDSFAKAFSQASSQKQQGKQFDAKQKEDARQFDAKVAEEKRQFDTRNPALPGARGASESPVVQDPPPAGAIDPGVSSYTNSDGAPAYDAVSGQGWLQTGAPPTIQDAPPAGMIDPGAGWNGSPAAGWQQYKFNTPTEAISGVLGAKNVEEAASIRSANADWEANPTYRKWMDDAFKAPTHREQARIASDRVKIAASREANLTIGSQVMSDMGKKFNTDIAALSKVDDVAAQRILEMPMTNHELLGKLPSADARAALGAALKSQEDKKRADLVALAAQNKLEPSAINAKGGVSFARPFASANSATGKLPQGNTDARKILESEMNQARRDIARVSKQMVDAVSDSQKGELRKQADELQKTLKAAQAEYMRLGSGTNAPSTNATAAPNKSSNDPLGLFQ